MCPELETEIALLQKELVAMDEANNPEKTAYETLQDNLTTKTSAIIELD